MPAAVPTCSRCSAGFGICRGSGQDLAEDCLVLFGAIGGLCGGFNAELFRFMDRALAAEDETPHIISCSRKASAYLREHSLAYEEFILSDVPDYEETHALCEHLKKLYTTGAVNRVRLIYQSYRNMLSQEPTDRQILPDRSRIRPRTRMAFCICRVPPLSARGSRSPV